MPPGPSTHRRRPRRLRLAASLLAVALAAALAAVVLVRLPARLRFQPVRLAGPPAKLATVNALGAGEDYFAIASGMQLILARLEGAQILALWQYNHPLPISLDRGVDIDGDGLEEITFHTRGATGSLAGVLDARGRLIRTFGPTRRTGNPSRPGTETLRGLAAVGGAKPGLLCILSEPECPGAIVLFDLADGDPAWEHWMGCWPRGVLAADLDGDAISEVLVETGSNGSALSINGTDDEHAYIIALDSEGRRIWQVPLAGVFSRVQLTLLGPGPDGRSRVLATSSSHRARNPEPGTATLLDGRTGQVLSRRSFVGGLGRPHVIPDGEPRVVLGGSTGSIRVLDRELRPIRERRLNSAVEIFGCADLDQDGTSELIATTATELLIMDQRLRVRATSPHPQRELEPAPVWLARAGQGRWRLHYGSEIPLVLTVSPIPSLQDVPRVATALSLVVVAGSIPFLVPGRRRRIVARAADARDFLTQFVEIQHETFAGTTPFSALRQWDQAIVGGVVPVLTLEEAASKFTVIGAPMLRRFAECASSLGGGKDRGRRILALVGEIEALLAEAQASPAARRSPVVQRTVECIDALSRECTAAHRDVAEPLGSRADIVAQEALRAKQAALVHTGIRFEFVAEPGAARLVLFDVDELRTLVGELIENAVRALEGRKGARIRVEARANPTDARWVLILVSDNGPGFRDDEREAPFAADYSLRAGGGFGLFRSRQVAQRWLGDLSIENRGPDPGAGVRLTLRVLFPHDSQRAT